MTDVLNLTGHSVYSVSSSRFDVDLKDNIDVFSKIERLNAGTGMSERIHGRGWPGAETVFRIYDCLSNYLV